MTKGDLNLFLNALHAAFLGGDWEDLNSMFKIPLVIYSEAGVSLIRDRVHLREVLQQYRAALSNTGVASTTLDVEHRDSPSDQRLRTTVRITDFGEDGDAIRHSLIRYFLVAEADSYKIEMVEYLKSSLSLTDIQRFVH